MPYEMKLNKQQHPVLLPEGIMLLRTHTNISKIMETLNISNSRNPAVKKSTETSEVFTSAFGRRVVPPFPEKTTRVAPQNPQVFF